MITLVNPNLVIQPDDIFTTGIVYMPIGLAYFAGALKKAGLEYNIVDAFGEKPQQYWRADRFVFRGLRPDEVLNRIHPDSSAAFIYAGNISSHNSVIRILQKIRSGRPGIHTVVMENTQAVTGYSLRRIQSVLQSKGAEFILTGEAEVRGVELARQLLPGAQQAGADSWTMDGIGCVKQGRTWYTPPAGTLSDLDGLHHPTWDQFPIRNYWTLKYAHGPFETDRYLPILTSRGCPYACRFCVIPETNGGKWRPRSASAVVDEMEAHGAAYGVREFHLEDVNPTVSDKRIREICREILDRGLKITWKMAAGTKVETIKDEDTLELLASAGCRYISISPETGSPRLLEGMGKPFDFDHAVRMIRKMNELGIYSQACFVLGFPGEEDRDLKMTSDLIRLLTKAGLDEVAVFIISPLPGAAIFEVYSGYDDYSQLNFSPSWRADYRKMNRFRLRLYLSFLSWKFLYHPAKLFEQSRHFLQRRFRTKMEMVPYRALKTFLPVRRAA